MFGVLEAFENGVTNIFKNRVHVSSVDNAMAKGTTIGVAVVVETRGQKGMMHKYTNSLIRTIHKDAQIV